MGAIIGFSIFGALMGWGMLFILVAMAQGKKKRTQIKIQSTTDLWPQIEQWCQDHGYKSRESVAGRRLYQRGNGFWQAAARLEVTQEGEIWQLDAFLFITSFVTHTDLALDETGPIAKLPRSQRKKELNMLLEQLGQPTV